MMLTTIILAAGNGQRAGGPKALMKLGDTTFLELALNNTRCCDKVIVVTNLQI
ncbi:MAG: nucleotidyltransferase family protein, partial [Candidatus Cloacimonetes bacterium]|nr:nucleotidyltransferase family protein [Candidatus Cloacimonadota bacterium]